MKTFEDLDLNDRLLTAISNMGYEEPTQIQVKSLPPILAGKDVIGESATGSGKTLAFGCGIVEHAVPRMGIQALILTPTRELAEQVKESLRQLSSQNPLSIIAIYGGTSIHHQMKSLKKADVVIATPGRLLDHLRRRTIDLSKVKLLVLDEADRMFDMGFIDDVEKIIKETSTKRQTLFFSATISGRVNKLAYKHMEEPVKVFAEKMVRPEKLEQVYYDVSKNMKLSLLTHLLQNEESALAMVFCNTRRTVDFVARNLQSHGIKAVAIHGGLSQKVRNRTIGLFNDAKEDVLVCTDVAARGLHIENVSHIYNFETPIVPNDYVHRIGRTARAGEEGKVINLLNNLDQKPFYKIQKKYPDFSITNVPRPKITQLKAIGTGGGRSSGGGGRRTPPQNHHHRHNKRRPYESKRHHKSSDVRPSPGKDHESIPQKHSDDDMPGQGSRHRRDNNTGFEPKNEQDGKNPFNSKNISEIRSSLGKNYEQVPQKQSDDVVPGQETRYRKRGNKYNNNFPRNKPKNRPGKRYGKKPSTKNKNPYEHGKKPYTGNNEGDNSPVTKMSYSKNKAATRRALSNKKYSHKKK